MSVVIADTSPINYLILIGHIDLLRSLYSRIIIPLEVLNELQSPGAPQPVSTWARIPPEWVEIRSVPPFAVPLLSEVCLDAGEEAAIRLALTEPGSRLVIDEAVGRSVASRLGLQNTGTLGVLLAASDAGLVDLRSSLHALQQTNFRISPLLLNRLLTRPGD